MKWVANLPDAKHTPFPVIAEEPHIKTVVRYFRPSDYLLAAGITLAGPGSLYLWGRCLTLTLRVSLFTS
jgi:hypothetical protein